jgi:hypothetical protein
MPRSDDWEDDDDEERPRRRRDRDEEERYERDRYDDEDDIDRPRRRGADKSGAVTAVGVINIVLGSLTTMLSLCVVVFGVFLAGVAADPQFGGPPKAARGIFGLAGAVALILGLIVLLMGVAYIISGIGILNRRNWARVLTLVLAGFTAVGALWNLIQLIQLVGGADVPGRAGQIMGQLVSVCLQIGYVVMAFTILLNSRYAEEFN